MQFVAFSFQRDTRIKTGHIGYRTGKTGFQKILERFISSACLLTQSYAAENKLLSPFGKWYQTGDEKRNFIVQIFSYKLNINQLVFLLSHSTFIGQYFSRLQFC